MKIGILTFHYSINQGSVLQAYCVFHLIKSAFPDADVEIINLIPLQRETAEWKFVGMKPPFVRTADIARYLGLRRFLKTNVKLSRCSHARNLERQIHFINRQNYDCIFTGSDTVWMDSPKLNSLLPHVYFLPEKIAARRIAVAVSVDPLLDESRYMERRDQLLRIFESYAAVTVRDGITGDLLKNLGFTNFETMPDPTFLYDFEKRLKLQINKDPRVKKKTVFIRITNQVLEQKVMLFLQEHSDYTFIDRYKNLSARDDFIKDDINQYANVDILITDRFHRSIFAVKLSNSLVINIERSDKNPVPKSKGRDLFADMGMHEFCVRYENNDADFKEKLFRLIEDWDAERFARREQLLTAYMSRGAESWRALMRHVR